MILSSSHSVIYRYISPVSPADVLTEKNHALILPLMDKKGRTLQIRRVLFMHCRLPYFLGSSQHYNNSIYPSVPCTRIRCPSFISWVAFSTPTTAGRPYSRAITAPWVISPPTSVTRPFMDTNNGVQPGSVKEVTNISPSSRSAFSMFKMTRALPSITPEENR